MRLISAVYLCAALLVAQQPPQQVARAAVSGVVTDGTTGQPIAGAVVELRRTPGVTAAVLSSNRATTDSKGRFVFMGVEPAEGYTMTARAASYIDATLGWKPGMSELIRDQLRFKLSAGDWKQDANIALWRKPTISGRVVDEAGNPVVGTAVRAFAVVNISGNPRLLASGQVAATDDRGVYRLSNLEPGQYKVAAISVQQTVPASVREVAQTRPVGALGASSYGQGTDSETSGPALGTDGTHRLVVSSFVTPPAPVNGSPRAYPTVFYPGVRAIDDAQIVALNYGDEQSSIDLRLQPVPAFTVSGRFDRPSPQPLLLRLMPRGHEDLAAGSEVATTVSDKDGAFTFLNVPAGAYTLMAQAPLTDLMWGSPTETRVLDPPGFPPGNTGGGSFPSMQNVAVHLRYGKPATMHGRMPLTVAGDLKDLTLPMLPTASIKGRVVFEPGSQLPAPPQFLSIRAEPADGDPSLGNADGRVAPAGSFEISGLLGGRYNLLTLSGMLVESIMWRGRDIADTGIDTRQDQVFDDVVVTMTNRGVVVKGTVTGIPANTRTSVIAFPAARDAWTNYGWNPRRVRTVTADATGSYELPKLPAGDYLLVAVDALKTNAWTDPKFLAAASTVAQRITIAWGETRSQDLTFSNVVVK
jgi:hypothetical protein